MVDLPHVGRLDERLTILRAVQTTNDYNEPVDSWTTYATIWARRIDASAGETVRAREVGAQVTAHFQVRHSSQTVTVTPKDRLQLEGGLIYDVTGVRELERNHWLEFHAVARQDR
jgi:SPP1 family predicted phage head-tail adaptor